MGPKKWLTVYVPNGEVWSFCEGVDDIPEGWEGVKSIFDNEIVNTQEDENPRGCVVDMRVESMRDDAVMITTHKGKTCTFNGMPYILSIE
jgi:hypothetical protein